VGKPRFILVNHFLHTRAPLVFQTYSLGVSGNRRPQVASALIPDVKYSCVHWVLIPKEYLLSFLMKLTLLKKYFDVMIFCV
jgi:hypothetical protein